MAVYWVPHYFALPSILEDVGMEDEARKVFHSDLTSQPQPVGNRGLGGTHSSARYEISERSQGNMEFAPLPLQHFGALSGGPHAFDMQQLANTLSDYSFAPYSQPQQQSAAAPLPAINQVSGYPVTAQQFAGQIARNINAQYSQQFGQGMNRQQPYNTYPQHQTLSQSPQNQHYLTQTMMSNPNEQRHAPYSGYGHQPPVVYPHMQPRMVGQYQPPPLQMDNNLGSLQPSYHPIHPKMRRNSSSSSLPTSSALRGPPRKPKQSGHALWVGNLPPGTHIIDLKDHFSRDATGDIESVFLISKSNCAFVNYKTEESCSAAMSRFHDSRFGGVRLVCRLRRGSSPASATPAAGQMLGSQTSAIHASLSDESAIVEPNHSSEEQENGTMNGADIPMVPEKYFVVKSLTTEDLERSLQTGIWATQAHNETTLNKAFKSAENVYLIFSANKSGEYFGYARMDSEIGSEPTDTTEDNAQEVKVPVAQSPIIGDVPVTITTPATATAPQGRVIDDSARGTIFWEAENDTQAASEAVEDGATGSGNASGEDTVARSAISSQTTYGKPFKITWQSTDRLPFYRTRGLRNPWNSNREVKIARDGTEIEPSVGRKLLGMFHQQTQINAANRSASHGPQYGYQQQAIHYPGMSDMPQAGYGFMHPGQGYGRFY